jgi:hypothetical protein
MAKKMEEGERRHVLLLLRPALWPLHCGGRLQLYLTIPCSLSLACSKKGYCAGAVVKWIIGYAGKNVRSAPGLKTESYPSHGGGF